MHRAEVGEHLWQVVVMAENSSTAWSGLRRARWSGPTQTEPSSWNQGQPILVKVLIPQLDALKHRLALDLLRKTVLLFAFNADSSLGMRSELTEVSSGKKALCSTLVSRSLPPA
jgi:hypothetical protein